MGMLTGLRNRGFWVLDAIKGSPVRKAYNEIKQLDCISSSELSIQEHQDRQWRKLKECAINTTVFYAPCRDCSFTEFPVIDKNIIRCQQDKFLSTIFSKDKLIQMSTSGSTGTPFVCYQNSGKKKRVNAECIYYSEKVGYHLGENLSYIRTIVKQVEKSKIKQFIQNQTLINCNRLNDAGVEKIIEELQNYSRKGTVTLLAYASTYTAIKDYIVKKGINIIPNIKITGVISGSEMLFDKTRKVLYHAFGKPEIVSRYSNEENGILGQDEGLNNVFTINEADYIVEILDENGEKVEDGKLGRIVVTDLYNYAMPMIRYDTGDIASIETIEINGRRKKCLTNFSGRKVDLISDVHGETLSPHLITNVMWSFTDVTQFQFIQKTEKEYVLKLNVPESFNRDTEVIRKIQDILGQEAVIVLEHVHEIPVLASGKRRYIVNEWEGKEGRN